MICPACESELDYEQDELDEGEEISCEECGADLIVVATAPLELEAVEEDELEEIDDDD